MQNGDYSMKMIKDVVILSLLATVSLRMLNIAAASSIANPHSASDSSIQLKVTDYPSQVNVGQNFDIHGILTKDNIGIGNAQVSHGELGQSSFMWTVTTNGDGSFTDTFHFNEQGGHAIYYTYIAGNKLPDDLYTTLAITINAIPK
jgi:hypothetical protein